MSNDPSNNNKVYVATVPDSEAQQTSRRFDG